MLLIFVDYMQMIIISHIADLDGITSAALIMQRYGIKKENVMFADYSVNRLLWIEKQIKKKIQKNTTLFITDIGTNASTIGIFSRIITFVKQSGGKVFWFDHHTWSNDSVEKLASKCDIAVVGENKLFCAAEITAAELELNDAFTKKLIRIVHMSDFNIKPKDKYSEEIIKSYVLSTTYYSSLNLAAYEKKTRSIAEQISNGVLIPKFIIADSRKFEKINSNRLKTLKKNIIADQIIALGFSKYVSTNDACACILDSAGVDIGVYLNTETSKCHLRSKINDCSLLAQTFGGGGHPHASGFEVNKDLYNVKTISGRKKLFKDMLKVSENLYNSSKA